MSIENLEEEIVKSAEERRLSNQMKARRKLLSLIPREDLDTIAGQDARPWQMNRPDLVDFIAYNNWDEDEVRAALNSLFHEARDKPTELTE